jgi:arylsulfatase A-like enzyme
MRKTNGSSHNGSASRTTLPIPDRPYTGVVKYDAKDPEAKFPAIEPLLPPQGAPNVLVILLDDVGFGASSAFGGPCDTPIFERLAESGLKYTRFHTAALCSPTRAALLTGRNHHSVGMGAITEIATSAPGYNSILPNSAATVAEILKLNGYGTAHFGKCHEVPTWETSPAGPFDRWPIGNGFEKFYGFVGGETNQWEPALYDGTTPIEPPKDPDYHLTEGLVTQCTGWIRQQKSLMPDKPFFVYFAPGATHSPHHVPKVWVDKYRAKFDGGWDKLRDETLARQKRLGVVPQDCKLTKRHDEIPAWDDMPADLKPVLARQMEIYAGFLSHTDHEIGRMLDGLKELGIFEDTLIYCIIGDNGASAEGTLQGLFNQVSLFNGVPEPIELLRERLDDFGSPRSYNHYAVGWAHAMGTPYQWTKQVASHWGGTRNGTIVHWPKGIKARNEIRHQFHHVIDVVPTILEAAGLPEPTMVNGVAQKPIEGVSMIYSFDDAKAADRHTTQYFEMFGNRGIYHEGWAAVTKHRTPWEIGAIATKPFDEDVWELYDSTKDWSQAEDLAKAHPEKLEELKQLWLIEAVKYNVLPLDDRAAERLNAEIAGRPELMRGRKSLLLGTGMGRLPESTVPNVKNKSFVVTAALVVPEDGASGVIASQGGRFGGWSLYAKDGRLKFCYNFLALERYFIEAQQALPIGTHQVRAEFAYDGGGLGKGGTVSLFVDGGKVGAGRVERTQAIIFSPDETMDVGYEAGSPVTDDLPPKNAFTGKVEWVNVAIGQEAFDQVIDPKEYLKVAMIRQ